VEKQKGGIWDRGWGEQENIRLKKRNQECDQGVEKEKAFEIRYG